KAVPRGAGGVRADDDDRDRRGGWITSQCAQDFLTRYVREVEVEEDEVWFPLPGELDSCAAPECRDRGPARPRLEQSLDEREVGDVVLDVEDGSRRTRVGCPGGHDALSLPRPLEWVAGTAEIEAEHAPLDACVLQLEVSPHGFRESSGERETEAGTLRLRLLRAQSSEGYEELIQPVLGDASPGVDHTDGGSRDAIGAARCPLDAYL